MDSQVHPRFSEAETVVGVGRHVHFLTSFTVESGGTLTDM